MSAVLIPASTTTTPPPVKAAPSIGSQPYRWTIEAYRKLGETGLFHGVKTMLIGGEIFTRVMPKPPHDLSLGMADDWLRTVFVDGYCVRNQMGFDIGTKNDPGPDLAVVVGNRRDYASRTPTAAVLIIEVADTSLFMDTTTKAELYATANVPEYWVVDLENRRLIVYRDPEPLPAGLGATAYRTRFTLAPDDTVSPLAAPTASVRVADLLS